EAKPYDLCETAEEFPFADRISDPALHEPECVWVVTTTTTTTSTTTITTTTPTSDRALKSQDASRII
ncbi:unnamed protein product, partial [Amoebophrya sp. A120]